MTMDTMMDVFVKDESPETIAQLQKGTQLIAEGKNQDGISILLELSEAKKVVIQQV